jgi:RimJ/RimL family protein N-acetyltransferase
MTDDALSVPPIISRRLELVSMSPAFTRAALEGDCARASHLIGAELPLDWPGPAARTLRRRLRQLEIDPSEQVWLLRAMVTRNGPPTLVGRIGFHAAPDARGALEIGYAVEPAHRRRGYATEAVGAMLGWAETAHQIHHFVASVSPVNVPSLALVRSFGFTQTGTQWDEEDGQELVFELRR